MNDFRSKFLKELSEECNFIQVKKAFEVSIKIKKKKIVKNYVDENLNPMSALKKCYKTHFESELKKDEYNNEIASWAIKYDFETAVTISDTLIDIVKQYWKLSDNANKNINCIDPFDHPDWMIGDNGKVATGYREKEKFCGYVKESGEWSSINSKTNVVDTSALLSQPPSSISLTEQPGSLKKLTMYYQGSFRIKNGKGEYIL